MPTIPSSYASLQSKTSSKITPSLELCNQIFLTGASGYFGAHLLYELLTAGVKKVVCLIRKRMGRSNDDVLKENLRNYGLLRRLESEHLERVETVTGDLTKVGFGVDGLTYENLLLKSDGIVHCAAIVSLAETFENLYLANVQGTKEVVKLAASIKATSGCSPRGVYISTNGIFPLKRLNMKQYKPISVENCNFENLPRSMIYGYNGSEETDSISSMCNGYGLSKWAAEKVITDSSDAFGLAFTTFRLGNVMHHSVTGHSNPLDFQSMFIRGCSKVGAAPVIPEWRLEGTPVDVAARTVVRVSGTSQSGNTIYHLVQPIQVHWSKAVSFMDEFRAESKMAKIAN